MTSLRYIFCFIGLLCSSLLLAQVPQNVILEPASAASSRACPDRNAGTISLGQHIGQSNDVALNRSFLCLNDRLNFTHNGDQEVVDSDPNPATTPGVGYIWYTCAPTVARTTLADIQTDPCLLTTPPPALGVWVYVDDINGDALFQNSNQIGGQSIPDFFNAGEPIEVWFAPFTVDAVNAGMPVLEGSPAGPCVHANVDAAFSIVYLTPMATQRRRIVSDGAGGCLGSFELFGGLPQFDASTFYNITVEHASQPGVFGTVLPGNYGHEDEVRFSFPQEGRYVVTVEDDKSCALVFEMDVSCLNANDPVIFNIGSGSGNNGDIVDIDITLENFDSLGAISFTLFWNPNVFEFVSHSGFLIDSDAASLFNENQTALGRLQASWLSRNLVIGQIEPDGTVFMRVQYRIVGACGDETPLDFTDGSIVVDYQNRDLLFEINEGLGAVNAGVFSANAGVCPDDGTGSGSVTLTICGGDAPYMINWVGPSPGSTSMQEQNGTQLFPNLLAGNYTFSIEDDNGVIINENVVVPVGTTHDVMVDIESPTCSNVSNGRVRLDIAPPGMYDITWSTNEFNIDSIIGVGNGQYAVTVTDGNGCSVSQSFTVNTEQIQLDVDITNATCLTSMNGSISVTALGGQPFDDGTYIYQWNGFPPNRATTVILSDRGRGDYTITVTDSNGCFTEQTYTITADREIVLDREPDITHLTCFGGMNGALEIQVSTLNASNDAGYLFEWNRGGINVSSSFASAADFSNSVVGLEAGRYDVTITDFDEGLDCILDTFFTINQPDPIQAELISMTPASCNDDDGELRINAFGGLTGPGTGLFLDWETHPELIDDFPNQQGLPADTFDVIIYQTTDNGNIDLSCFLDTFFIVTGEEGPRILSYDSTSVSCGGGMDGELEVFYAPAGQVFDVAWTDQDNNTYSGNPISGLSPGTYFVTVTASPGCVSVDTVRLGPATDIVLDSVRYTTPTCPNSGNGAIAIFATGPGSGLHYEWNHVNGSDNPVLPSVPVGNYAVTISVDGSTCPPLIIDTLRIRPPEIFTVNFTNIVGARCPGICDGQATINAIGGTGPLNFNWSSGEQTVTATMLCAGDNFVTVTDDLCADIFTVDIPAGDSIGMTSQQQNPMCFESTDGFIRINPSGLNPPFDIMWDDGPIVPDRLNLAADTFIVTVSDAMGCERRDTFVLTAPDELIAMIEPNNLGQITCAGRDDGSALITTTGGNGGNLYTWSPDVSQSNAAQSLTPGDYNVTVTDVNGCSDTISFSIMEPVPIQFVLGDQSEIACFGEPAQFTVDTAFSGAGGPYTFTINSGALHPLGEEVTLFGGDYIVSIFDSSGCFIDTAITISQPDEIELNIGDDITVDLGDSARLEIDLLLGQFPIDSFIWTSSGNDLSCTICEAPWITPFSNGTVMLVVVDSTGCQAIDELNVFVDARRKVFIPTAFSPNNDGINDIFQVFSGQGVQRILSMRIFNRWGGQVFSDNNLRASTRGSGGWNGTNNGNPLTPGVFAYLIQVEFIDGRVIDYKGEVQLIR